MATVYDRSTLAWRSGLGHRSVIVGACAASGVAAWWLGDPTPRLAADLETARLLQSMALIKGLFLAAAMAAVLWRLRSPIQGPWLAGYTFCLVAMSFAAVAVFQLTFLAVTSFVFHGALIGLLVIAWRDDGVGGSGRGSSRSDN